LHLVPCLGLLPTAPRLLVLWIVYHDEHHSDGALRSAERAVAEPQTEPPLVHDSEGDEGTARDRPLCRDGPNAKRLDTHDGASRFVIDGGLWSPSPVAGPRRLGLGVQGRP